ncbi:SIS domain-containing protein [Nonomuraea pusilla]|uniref:D-sedoheptulose-7-phosphate isomerase n=1 Tax=Nonomuraea pusilla TaxID=46177 RepID=UPI003324FF0E
MAIALESRTAPLRHLAEHAGDVARACHAMAVRFHGGGRLLVFGDGTSSSDAQHVAVEFVHPVIVGKRALPALALTADVSTMTGVAARDGFAEVYAHQIRHLAAPGDIALGLAADGDDAAVRRGLEQARSAGLLCVAMTAAHGPPPEAAHHVLTAAATDPRIVKEVHVTMYHVLWELVHVFLQQPGTLR